MLNLSPINIRRWKYILFSLIVFLTSCAPAYIPNIVNTPLFSNKGEFTANIGGGSNGIDAQVAYAATNHFAVMVNSSFSDQSNQSDYDNHNISFHNHRYLEGGLGYFSMPNNWLNFEIYGGWGYGKVNGYGGLFSDSISGNYNRFFIQPSMGTVSESFDLGFSPRFVMVNFDGRVNNSNPYVSGTSMFIEPTLTVKLGFKQFKFIGQIGYSYKINSKNFNFNYQPFMFSVGTQLTLGRKREKSIID